MTIKRKRATNLQPGTKTSRTLHKSEPTPTAVQYQNSNTLNASFSTTSTTEYSDYQDFLKQLELERIQHEKLCDEYVQPKDFRCEIDSLVDQLNLSLNKCPACECMHFHESDIKDEDQLIQQANLDYECSSEASSAFVSLIELEEEDEQKLVIAARINEARKRDILALPFTDEYLTVKTLKKKHSLDESSSVHSSMMRPMDDKDNRYTRPAWITGLHDPIGLGAYEWDKMMKEILGQGRHGRSSCREPFFRFELPPNINSMKEYKPIHYLEKYCFISDRRLALYHKEFTRQKEMKENFILGKKLYKALNNIMVNTLTKDQYSYICDLLDVNMDEELQAKCFYGICAVTERLFFCKNLTSSSEESFEIQKGYVERADFMNLKSKLFNNNLSKKLEELFYVL